jgi:DNA (cytosine-5)-methyltransferase 1
VILFGIRSDVAAATPALAREPGRFKLKKAPSEVGVACALSGLPPLRSKLSGKDASAAAWRAALERAPLSLKLWRDIERMDIETAMHQAYKRSARYESSGAAWTPMHLDYGEEMPRKLASWYRDRRLGGVIQHESRSHMEADLHRYMFASIFASRTGQSPKLPSYPPKLLPDHKNVKDEDKATPFIDRFRVQVKDKPSTTVVSHISKDGHYYIHHDPSQCRSFTAREAARIQTFPDNYFFEGGRTYQFHQIGNAVPPLLARQIAEVVSDFLACSR